MIDLLQRRLPNSCLLPIGALCATAMHSDDFDPSFSIARFLKSKTILNGKTITKIAKIYAPCVSNRKGIILFNSVVATFMVYLA